MVEIPRSAPSAHRSFSHWPGADRGRGRTDQHHSSKAGGLTICDHCHGHRRGDGDFRRVLWLAQRRLRRCVARHHFVSPPLAGNHRRGWSFDRVRDRSGGTNGRSDHGFQRVPMGVDCLCDCGWNWCALRRRDGLRKRVSHQGALSGGRPGSSGGERRRNGGASQ